MKALPLSLLLLSGAALADDAAILQCRALTDAGARLACYDAIQVGAKPQVASATAAPARTPEENFGVEQKKQREEAPKSMTSTVAGEFDGWGPGTQISLANGQVWRVVDDSQAVLRRLHNPTVTIERGLLGALYLSVEGSNRRARVTRVR